jgi:type VII secretion protein EccE
MTARITLALLFIVPAGMAYPWPSIRDRWVLSAAVVAVIVLFGWWRGEFLTTIAGRRIAMWFRHNRKASPSLEYTSVLLRVDAPDTVELPLPLVASYLDRYGIRCDKVRVTHRDADGQRATWVGLTLGAAENLTALQARSARIPLQDTAEWWLVGSPNICVSRDGTCRSWTRPTGPPVTRPRRRGEVWAVRPDTSPPTT